MFSRWSVTLETEDGTVLNDMVLGDEEEEEEEEEDHVEVVAEKVSELALPVAESNTSKPVPDEPLPIFVSSLPQVKIIQRSIKGIQITTTWPLGGKFRSHRMVKSQYLGMRWRLHQGQF
jgi:hypothetical protein